MARRRPHFLSSIVTPEPPRRRRRPPPPEREVGDFQGNSHATTSLKIVSSRAFKAGYLDRTRELPPRNGYIEDDTGNYERGRATANSLIVRRGVHRLPSASDKEGLVTALDLARLRGDLL
jgi:hypothetical protein